MIYSWTVQKTRTRQRVQLLANKDCVGQEHQSSAWIATCILLREVDQEVSCYAEQRCGSPLLWLKLLSWKS